MVDLDAVVNKGLLKHLFREGSVVIHHYVYGGRKYTVTIEEV